MFLPDVTLHRHKLKEEDLKSEAASSKNTELNMRI